MTFVNRAQASRALGATLVAISLSACADMATEPTSDAARRPLANIVTPAARTTVCKVGPAGTYKFNIRSWDGFQYLYGKLLVTPPFTLAAGDCVDVLEGGEDLDGLFISEIELPAGVTLEKITVQEKGGTCDLSTGAYCPKTYTGVSEVYTETYNARGYTITFYNKGGEVPPPPPPPPPPTGGEGCTPGFWKNSTGSWVGYTTGQSFDAVFGVNAFNPDITLLQALGLNGGGVKALARHAAAALLNSAHNSVDYGMTTEQVMALVKAALAPGGDIEAAKNKLAALNEKGCALANDNSYTKKK